MGLVCFMWQILLLPFCKGGGGVGGTKQKLHPWQGSWVTQSGKGMKSNLISLLSGVSMAIKFWGMTGFTSKRLPFQSVGLSSKDSLTLSIPWWGSRHWLQGRPWVNSHHTALDSLSTDKAPKSTWPRTLWRQHCRCLPSFCLKVTCLTSTVGMQSSSYPYRIVKWNTIIHVTHLLEAWQWELLFTTSF